VSVEAAGRPQCQARSI